MRALITGRRLLIALTVAVAVVAVLTAFHDLPAVGRALRGFDWRLLPLALLLSSAMHLLRFARWHIYACRVATKTLRPGDSLLIYGAGLGTHLTPGRAGEVVRFVFLRRATETPLTRSAPIILAERLTDGIGMAGMALPGALALGLGGRRALPLLLLPLLVLLLLAGRRGQRAALTLLGRAPLLRRYTGPLADAGEELRGLLAPRLLLAAGTLSLLSVALEVATLTVVLKGVGLALTPETYLRAAFVLPAAMLASAVILVPGKLGVAEGGLAALTRAALSAPAAPAAAAAVIVRLCTLWWGLALGTAALVVATHRYGRMKDEG